MNGRRTIEAVARSLSASVALARKAPVGRVVEGLAAGFLPEGWPDAFGEDAAPVPFADGYLLLAADGVASGLLADPFWAGYCGVLVNANDIAAMGGCPLAMVNVLSGPDAEWRDEVVRGMAFGSRHLGIPMVGGHLHPDDAPPAVSVAVLGSAATIVRSSTAGPGDSVLIVADTTGGWHVPFPNWDSTTARSSEEARRHLGLVPELAGAGLLVACKDVSNPGFLGTLLMLLESSGVGALVDIGAIPRPRGVDLVDWVESYPGCAYVLVARGEHVERIVSLSVDVGLSAARVGRIVPGSRLMIDAGGVATEVWDHEARPVTGVRRAPRLY